MPRGVWTTGRACAASSEDGDEGARQRDQGGIVTYDGAVTPGGPAKTRELSDLTITKLSVGPMDNNAYLLRCKATGEAGAHRRRQRARAAARVDRRQPAVHCGHHPSAPRPLAGPAARGRRHRRRVRRPPGRRRRHPGGHVHCGGWRHGSRSGGARWRSSASRVTRPARSPCSTRPDGGHLFTGDSLFPGGVGNTDKDPARFASLIDDVSTKIFDRLPDETWFYPGHGKDSTLGAERPPLAGVARPRLVTERPADHEYHGQVTTNMASR